MKVGTRMYNHGDRANQSHFGTLTAIKTGAWGTQYEITPDADSGLGKPYWIPSALVSLEFKGHGGTRIVTEEAYDTFRNARLAELHATMARQAGAP
mgnify:CR=1 FL=1